MTCVRCGCGVCHTEDAISLNKMWHRSCFTCRNCNEKLDKSSAKLYQGDVYCEKCQKCICEAGQNVCCPTYKPCRVVSSPSFICIPRKDSAEQVRPCCPKFNNCTKVCFSREKIKCPNASRSCSYITEVKKVPCFGFPMPREVANYYSRKNMRKNCEPCCRSRKPRTCMKVRSLSPQKRCIPQRCRSPSPRPICTCGRCCQPHPRCQPPQEYCTCNHSAKQSKPCKPCCKSRSPAIPCLPQNYESPCTCSMCCPPKPPGPSNQCCPKQPRVYPKPYCPPQPRCPSKPCCPPPKCPAQKRDSCYPCQTARVCCPNNRPECIRQCKCTCVVLPKCACGGLCCDCTICQVRAACQSICNRCGQKVYAAEKISVSCGAYHSCCFTCYCCRKLLDVKTVFEHCNEIYCRNCYNHYFGIQCYGFGSS